jgi:hypothetical protein
MNCNEILVELIEFELKLKVFTQVGISGRFIVREFAMPARTTPASDSLGLIVN